MFWAKKKKNQKTKKRNISEKSLAFIKIVDNFERVSEPFF